MQLGKILISAAIAVAPLLAQKKAVVAKKAPTKEPVATPAPEPKAAESARLAEAPAKPAANSDSELKFSALVWGGYNIPSSDYFQQATSGLTQGGVAGGVEALLGTGLIRGGVATSYIPVYVFDSGAAKTTKTLMPFEGVLNLYLFVFTSVVAAVISSTSVRRLAPVQPIRRLTELRSVARWATNILWRRSRSTLVS
jgi:hypothetical protein